MQFHEDWCSLSCLWEGHGGAITASRALCVQEEQFNRTPE